MTSSTTKTAQIDNSLSAHSHCCQISYFMACNVGRYCYTEHILQATLVTKKNIVSKIFGCITFAISRNFLEFLIWMGYTEQALQPVTLVAKKHKIYKVGCEYAEG